VSDDGSSANDDPAAGRVAADLDAMIRQFAARIDRLERELKDLRAQLEATRASPRAAGSGTA
jgi:Skp family chaperone for outer membrane proteins